MEHVKTMGSTKTMEDLDITATNPFTAVEEDPDHTKIRIGAEAVVVDLIVILHINIGHTECVPIQAKTARPHHMATKRTQYGVTRSRSLRETAPDMSGQFLLIKLI